MRGARGPLDADVYQRGIIPAYAGSTTQESASASSRRDHPRVCGEHQFHICKNRKRQGSSPRMRGARRGAENLPRGRGIIPAYAGSTRHGNLYRPNGRDHPRVCGEHYYGDMTGLATKGSSPRMRGALLDAVDGRREDGIIPAYAGSTAAATAITSDEVDHPRVCGEHPPIASELLMYPGSSPRMRGARVSKVGQGSYVGIIPAYAGSTSFSVPIPVPFRDHPRVCGEHRPLWQRRHLMAGSSPRMRGAHQRRGRSLPILGIIPAYAGSTRTYHGSCRCNRDHPRVCGEHIASRKLPV